MARAKLGLGGGIDRPWRNKWSSLAVDSGLAGGHWRGLPTPGEVAEWLKAADCKSARASVRWFESSPLHHFHQSLSISVDSTKGSVRGDVTSCTGSPLGRNVGAIDVRSR